MYDYKQIYPSRITSNINKHDLRISKMASQSACWQPWRCELKHKNSYMEEEKQFWQANLWFLQMNHDTCAHLLTHQIKEAINK